MEQLITHLEGARKKDFAKSIGVSPSYLSQILSGLRRPGLDLALKIQSASHGKVKLKDWKHLADIADAVNAA